MPWPTGPKCSTRVASDAKIGRAASRSGGIRSDQQGERAGRRRRRAVRSRVHPHSENRAYAPAARARAPSRATASSTRSPAHAVSCRPPARPASPSHMAVDDSSSAVMPMITSAFCAASTRRVGDAGAELRRTAWRVRGAIEYRQGMAGGEQSRRHAAAHASQVREKRRASVESQLPLCTASLSMASNAVAIEAPPVHVLRRNDPLHARLREQALERRIAHRAAAAPP